MQNSTATRLTRKKYDRGETRSAGGRKGRQQRVFGKISDGKNRGTTLLDEQEVAVANGKRVILTYTGDKTYTLIEEKAEVLPAASTEPIPANGEMADLGFAFGIKTGDSLSWTVNGVEYTLASKSLTAAEMMEVAQSVGGEPEK